ncbi:MAG: adenylate/guanylate cyclase domain-containing protein, partial [Acinetobacter sp.]|nr:adenylate/guanylate cyclase domain-containing protein [Acinetobacter sp.]
MKNLQFLYTLIVKTSSPYRLLSYCTLFLTVLIYQLYLQEWQQVLSVPIVLFLLYILASFIPKKSPLKRYRYAYFLIDMLACAFILWQLEFNFILSVFILSGLFFSLAFQKAPFEKFLVFFIASAWILWPSLQLPLIQHLSVFSPLLFLIYVLLLAAFIFLGIYWQNQQLVATRKKKDTYYQQMVHYMDFANQLSRYAPSQLWQAIIRGESEAKIEYKRKKLTIFFSDIQGFTQLSESLIPEDLAYLLNEYLRHMTQISRQYNATIDKFMGDGILMFFGDIDSKGIEQDAKSCVDMAIAMRQQMKILRERWQKMGYPALHIR